MKFENTEVFNIEGAFRGLRNPLESWAKSDNVGENDINLAQRMISADAEGDGEPNSKFLRQIMVCVDITAPLYWLKQFDTYKVGTVANSTSTMHKLATTPITFDCFETGDYDGDLVAFEREPYNYDPTIQDIMEDQINFLENLRRKYLETKNIKYWKELIRWLPESWLQKRTVTMNYATLRNMVRWRSHHKLNEWHWFVDWVHTLPYADSLIFYKNVE